MKLEEPRKRKSFRHLIPESKVCAVEWVRGIHRLINLEPLRSVSYLIWDLCGRVYPLPKVELTTVIRHSILQEWNGIWNCVHIVMEMGSH